MSKILDALKGISSFPGTLKDLLIEFEQRIVVLEKTAGPDVVKVGADLAADVAPNEALATRIASLEQTVTDIVKTVSDLKAAVNAPAAAAAAKPK